MTQFGLFYLGTYALVDHDDFVVRYGEIKKDIAKDLGIGSRVTKGQKIGLVGKLTGLNISMIHFEMYAGTKNGPLTERDRPPFMRRSDLIDPARHLDIWAGEPLPVGH